MTKERHHPALPEKARASTPLARLIPVVADTNKEERAASIVLASLSAVPEYAATMLGTLNQKVGVRSEVFCFTEVEFQNKGAGSAAKLRPDGLIALQKNKKEKPWYCLVEAKVGNQELRADQIEQYVKLAKENGIDAVLTISNQFVAVPTHSPVSLPKSVMRGVELYHWSWVSAVTQAEMLISEGDIENDKDIFILREMLRYMWHKSAGISTFDRMNTTWTDLVKRISSEESVKRTDPSVESAVADWHQEVRDLCLLMSRDLEAAVKISLPKAHREDQGRRLKDDCEQLVKERKLYGKLDVPNTASALEILAHMGSRWLMVYMTLAAPKDKKRATARINWLLRQLSKAESTEIEIIAYWPGRAPVTQQPLAVLREDPDALLSENKALTPTSFQVVMKRDLAGKFSKPQLFIQQLESLVPAFYQQVGQHLRAYVPPPPKPKKEPKFDARSTTSADTGGEIDQGLDSESIADSDKTSTPARHMGIFHAFGGMPKQGN